MSCEEGQKNVGDEPSGVVNTRECTSKGKTCLSTLLSEVFFRSRLNASVRCSFVTTAESQNDSRLKEGNSDAPSCRSLAII
jgi:hypothetical protein